jgi:hypothetical protein
MNYPKELIDKITSVSSDIKQKIKEKYFDKFSDVPYFKKCSQN